MAAREFVLDASVALSWCFEDEVDVYGDTVLESLALMEAVVPSVWPLEMGNALLVAERRKRLTKADVVHFLELLRQLPITVEQEPLERVWGEILALAREQKLSAYDASYLDLAMRRGLPLATRDEALRQAAIHCGVKVHMEQG